VARREWKMADEDRQVIIPRYKMIVSYDIRLSHQDEYYQFVLGELVPRLQEMGVFMTEAWHTAFGEYPMRMVTFVVEEYQTLDELFDSPEWTQLEAELLHFVENYSLRVLRYRSGFQFITNN
jgi:hypothetical protein